MSTKESATAFDVELKKRDEAGEYLSLADVSKKLNVLFATWDDYHDGDTYRLMNLLRQTGYHYAEEIGHVNATSAPDALELGSGYLFVYSKKRLTASAIKGIKKSLCLDLAEKHNVDWWL